METIGVSSLVLEKKYTMSLSEKEKHLIEIIRSTECAHITVYVQNYIPLRVEKTTKSYKL